jgi:hypothetical protein
VEKRDQLYYFFKLFLNYGSKSMILSKQNTLGPVTKTDSLSLLGKGPMSISDMIGKGDFKMFYLGHLKYFFIVFNVFDKCQY